MSGGPLTYLEQTAYRVLAAAAQDGAPCPTNDAILCSGKVTGAGLLLRLEAKAKIAVERRGKARRVCDLASGKWTGWSAIERGVVGAGVGDGPKLTAEEIAARRVDRDPFKVCGARGDAGCGHATSSRLAFIPGTAWVRSHGKGNLRVQA